MYQQHANPSQHMQEYYKYHQNRSGCLRYPVLINPHHIQHSANSEQFSQLGKALTLKRSDYRGLGSGAFDNR